MTIHPEQSAGSFPLTQSYADALRDLGSHLAHQGWIGGSVSYRYALGFVMDSCSENLAKISDAHFVFVESWDWATSNVRYRGSKMPSTEAFLHAGIYENRSGVIFAVCVEGSLSAPSSQSLPVIHLKENPLELKAELENQLGKGNLFRVEGIGYLALGCTVEDLSQLLKI
jgi:hypothetical protein